MDKLKQFIYTGTKKGFDTWGKSEGLPSIVSDNIFRLYGTYKEDGKAKIAFKNTENGNPNDFFPIKRKYSIAKEGCVILQYNYIGYELYNKGRLGNVFLHGYYVESPSAPPIACFLKDGFFSRCLDENQAQMANSDRPLDDVYMPDLSYEQAVEELCSFMNSEQRCRKLAICLDIILEIINKENEHLVFLNVKKGDELWGLIKCMALLLPEELSLKMTFDTMFCPSDREIYRSFRLLSACDKIIGFYEGDKDGLFESSKEFDNKYTVIDMDVEDFGRATSERVYRFVNGIFENQESARDVLGLYLDRLAKGDCNNFDKMESIILNVASLSNKLPYLTVSEISKLMLRGEDSKKVIYKALEKKLESSVDSLFEASKEIESAFSLSGSMIDGVIVNLLCKKGLTDKYVKEMLNQDRDAYACLSKLIEKIGHDGEFLGILEDTINEYLGDYATKIAGLLLSGDEFAKEQAMFVKKFAFNGASQIGKEISLALESRMENIVKLFLDGKAEYRVIRDIVGEYYPDGLQMIDSGIAGYAYANASNIAEGLLKEDENAKALYNELAENEKNAVALATSKIIKSNANENLEKLFDGDAGSLSYFECACSIMPSIRTVIATEIEQYVQINRAKIANLLMQRDENAENAFSALMDYTENISSDVSQVIYNDFSKKADGYVLSFASGDFNKIDKFVDKASRICADVKALFDNKLKSYYFDGESKKSIVKEYVKDECNEYFDVIKKRIPNFDSLISDAIYEIYKEELDCLINQIYSGNVSEAIKKVDKYCNYSSKVNKDELYIKIYSNFDNENVWKNLLENDLKTVNSVRALKDTSYMNQLKNSFYRYLLSGGARAHGYTINQSISRLNSLGVEYLVSIDELYESFNNWKDQELDSDAFAFVEKYFKTVGDNNGEQKTSPYMYKMLFKNAVRAADGFDMIIKAVEQFSKVEPIDALIEIFDTKGNLDRVEAYKIIDSIIGNISYTEAIDMLLSKNVQIATRYYEDYVSEQLEGNVALEILKACKNNAFCVLKSGISIVKILKRLDNEDRARAFASIVEDLDDSIKVLFLKEYFFLYGFGDFDERHVKALSKAFSQKTVYTNLLHTYLSLFGKYTRSEFNIERCVREAVNEAYVKQDEEKKKRAYSANRIKTEISIIKHIVNNDISYEHISYFIDVFGQEFIQYLLVYFMLNIDDRFYEKQLNQIVDYSKREKIITSLDLFAVYGLNKELCDKIAIELSINQKMSELVFNSNNERKDSISGMVYNIVEYGGVLSENTVNAIISYIEKCKGSQPKNMLIITRGIMKTVELNELSAKLYDRIIALAESLDDIKGYCTANLKVLEAIKAKKEPDGKYIGIINNEKNTDNDSKNERIRSNLSKCAVKVGLERKYNENIVNYLYKCYGNCYVQWVYDSAINVLTTKDCLRGIEKSAEILYNNNKQLYCKLIYNIECLIGLGNDKLQKAITKIKK